MILMPINNHAKHIRTHQTNLPTSSRFPFVSWPCDPWCYTNWDRSGSACNFSGSCHVDSRSVCQILPGAPRHDLWEVCHAGVLSRCPTATYGIRTKQEKIMGHTFVVSPNFSPRFPVCFQMFKVSHVFHHLFPAFHPFFHRCSPTFPPWNSPFQARRSRGETSPAQRWFHGCVSGYTTRSRECCVLRKAPKGSERPKICDVAHSESLDMIGHLRCEWIRFRLFDINRHSESIWHHWNIYNI